MALRTLPWQRFAAIGIIALLGACSQTRPPDAPHPQIAWYKVHFDNDSSAIPSDGQGAIDDAALFLKQHPHSFATVIGKTDSVGGPDYNMHLSHQRADAVRDALVYDDKIPADHVETRWTGEAHQDQQTGGGVAAAGNRVVDIAIHY